MKYFLVIRIDLDDTNFSESKICYQALREDVYAQENINIEDAQGIDLGNRSELWIQDDEHIIIIELPEKDK